jgi:hypothetical protein
MDYSGKQQLQVTATKKLLTKFHFRGQDPGGRCYDN